MTTVELHYLNRPKVDSQIFSGTAALDGWRWIVDRVSWRFGCDSGDVDCLEAEDGGDDFVTVNGKPVARIVHKFTRN